MCGIFGVLEHRHDAEPDARMLEESAGLLAHRGPDHAEHFCEPGIGLAHTRLSLLDLSPRSHQPLWDQSGRYCIVYNGEIYNFKTLRTDLERQGVTFHTTSDTEVLIESIVRTGLEETLPKLEGMYTFALFDRQDRSLTLARDRFGIKPLFVYEDSESFIFSSEIRAMLPWRRFDLDPLRASGFLVELGTFNRGFTLLKGVRMVDPGTILRVKPDETAQSTRFFFLGDLWDEDQQEAMLGWSSGTTVDKVESALLSAIEMQQIADAPVGALCSGGVDSSLAVAMASRFQADIQVFHAHTPGKDSELESAAAIAGHLNLDLQTVDVTDQDHIDLLPVTILHRGNPFVDLPTSVPFLKLSRLVRSHGVKGVLTGEGADECFWGFDRMIPNSVRFVRNLPGRGHRLVIRSVKRLLGERIASQSRGQDDLTPRLLSRFEGAMEDDEIRWKIRELSGGSAKRRDVQSLHELNHNLRALLNRNDACGMAASVESRFPFLDYQLVKLAINLPNRYKAHFSPTALHPGHPFMIDKWVLRQVADRYMPRSLSRRPKVPWPSSAHQRMVIPQRYFETSFVRDLFGFSHRELGYLMARAPHSLKLKLLHLEVWAQMFLNGSPPEEQAEHLRSAIAVEPAVGPQSSRAR
jgi:asparagine synthase (glutamine-hydrolysing)